MVGKQYLVVELHSLCIVGIGFSLKRITGDGLGTNLATKDAANNIIILQRSV